MHNDKKSTNETTPLNSIQNRINISKLNSRPPNNKSNFQRKIKFKTYNTTPNSDEEIYVNKQECINPYNFLYIISCIILCLNTGITFVANFHVPLKSLTGYPDILINQLIVIGVACSASVGFVLDRILDVIPLKTAIILNASLSSLYYFLMMGLIDIHDGKHLTGTLYFVVVTTLIVIWAILNFLSGFNLFMSIKIARLYTKKKYVSTVIGILSCASSLSITFISLMHDSINNDLSLFFGVLSIANLVSIMLYLLFHQEPSWYKKLKQEEKDKLSNDNKIRSRMSSTVFVNTSSVFETSILSKDANEYNNEISYSHYNDNIDTKDNIHRKRTKSILFSSVKCDENNSFNVVLSFKEVSKLSFFNELFTFKAMVCVVTVLLCMGIQKNIYFVMKEVSVYIVEISNGQNHKTPEFSLTVAELLSYYGKITSITSALARLVSGLILDYLYMKKWICSPFPMATFFLMLLFGACLFAAISPYWAVRTLILQISFGLSGGLYGILPVMVGVLVSMDNYNKLFGFAEFSSTIGLILFTNLTTIIDVLFEEGYILNIYFGICCFCMGFLTILNFVITKRITKEVLNK